MSGWRTWHRWFAWYPVEVGDSTVWLEFVERKGTWCYDGLEWAYREIKNV